MLDQIYSAFDAALGLKLEASEISAWQMSLRAIVVFTLATAMIRIGNKRFMGKSTAMDVMLGIVFGSLTSRAITGNSPFLPTLAASLTLVLFHWLISALAHRSPGFGKLVKGHPTLLVEDGVLQADALRAAHITERDLHEALRQHSKPPDLRQIASAHLERNGDISIIPRKD
ncbi:MAG TPA: YetF domain-containing protein [Chthoniobacteraceae bacterium]|jgi:uncharacterized membrane protein YcaP (DUF421 family)